MPYLHADSSRGVQMGGTALHMAAIYNHCKAIKVLVQAGSDIDATDNNKFTALHHAARKGNLEAVQELIFFKPNLDPVNCTPHSLMVTELASQSVVQGTLVHLQAHVIARVREELEPSWATKSQVLVGEEVSGTPLLHATVRGDAAVVESLAAAHANPGITDSLQNSPLLLATDNGVRAKFLFLVLSEFLFTR